MAAAAAASAWRAAVSQPASNEKKWVRRGWTEPLKTFTPWPRPSGRWTDYWSGSCWLQWNGMIVSARLSQSTTGLLTSNTPAGHWTPQNSPPLSILPRIVWSAVPFTFRWTHKSRTSQSECDWLASLSVLHWLVLTLWVESFTGNRESDCWLLIQGFQTDQFDWW